MALTYQPQGNNSSTFHSGYRHHPGMESPFANADATIVHISNLHCSSCVKTIEDSLAALSPAPLLVEVSIVLQSVKVRHLRDLSSSTIQEALSQEGFDVVPEDAPTGPKKIQRHPKHIENCVVCQAEEHQSSSEIHGTEKHISLDSASTESGPIKITLSISGMTCSSCSSTITRLVSDIPGLSDVSVSLLDNSATAIARSQDLCNIVKSTIDDAGYEATIVSAEPIVSVGAFESPRKTGMSTRTVSLIIHGMFCQRCPQKVLDALETLDVQIIKRPTCEDPILTLSYSPRPPLFTIRGIISAITAVSPQFSVTIHKPTSIEERSRALQLREQHDYLLRLAFAFVVAIPTFIIGIVYMVLVRDGDPNKEYLMAPMWAGNASRSEWALFFMATPVMFYSANVFHRRAIKEVRALWRPRSAVPIWKRFVRFGSMSLLVSCGVSVAYFASIALLALAAVQHPSHTGMGDTTTYFDSVVFLTMFLLAGRYLEAYSKARTADAITALSSLRPEKALVVVPDPGSSDASFSESGKDIEKADPESEAAVVSTPPGKKIEAVPVEQLEVGDTVRILVGATPPADGTIALGEQSVFDESSLTGESKLVDKVAGDKVYLGTINRGRVVHVLVDEIGGQTMLDNIVAVVREGQTRRAPLERVADRITAYFVPIITLLAILTWVIWLSLGLSGRLPSDYLDAEIGGWPLWSLEFAIAVFVIACPCGIGLAAPTALLVGSGLAAKFGILARGGGEAFEEMSHIDVIVFDKTGTITEGTKTQVSDVALHPRTTWDLQTALGVASELESATSHPLAIAIREHCEQNGASSQSGSDFIETAGRGLRARFESLQCTAIIGNEAWMKDHDVAPGEELISSMGIWKSEGKSVVLLAIQRDPQDPSLSSSFEPVGVFAVTDVIRQEATGVIRWFQKQNLKTWMLSGDNQATASAIAAAVGIPHDNVIAGVLPHEKAEKIQWLQQSLEHRRSKSNPRTVVAMVGDGINDAPALTVADVGIAIAGSDITVRSASFVLLNSNLVGLVALADLSRTVIRRVKFNFAWACLYNLVALPVAAGVIYPAGHVRLDPVWAALAMALSSVSVVLSSLLLRLYRPPKEIRRILADKS